MSKPDHWLLEHKADKASQFGEDGILQKILEILPEPVEPVEPVGIFTEGVEGGWLAG